MCSFIANLQPLVFSWMHICNALLFAEVTQNKTNPYYIHPKENTTLVLVSLVLSSPNYHSWARAMRMALLSENKLKFVDRSIVPPGSSDLAWEICNTMVLSWIT